MTSKSKSKLVLIDPFTTFSEDGKPKPVPYVIDGLLTQGGFSVLGAKPKHGKSSMSRVQAVAVAKGLPFLGRTTTQGDVLLVSLEDQLEVVDMSLNVLEWNATKDARIKIITQLPPASGTVEDKLEHLIFSLAEVLHQYPDARLLVIDTLAKALRVRDLNDYIDTMSAVEKFHKLARAYPKVHVEGLVHCKKISTDDPFDALLGSTALRGEPDTNVVIYDTENRMRVIEAEVRLGKRIDKTLLSAEIVESAGADIIKNFSLGKAYEAWQEETEEKKTRNKLDDTRNRIREFLQSKQNQEFPQEAALKELGGRRSDVLNAAHALCPDGLEITGTPKSKTNPLVWKLKTFNPLQAFIEKNGSVQ